MKLIIYLVAILIPTDAYTGPQLDMLKPYLPWAVTATSVIASLMYGAWITKKAVHSVEKYKAECQREGIFIAKNEKGEIGTAQTNNFFYNFLTRRAFFYYNDMPSSSELQLIPSEKVTVPLVKMVRKRNQKTNEEQTQIILDSSIFDLCKRKYSDWCISHLGKPYQFRESITMDILVGSMLEEVTQ